MRLIDKFAEGFPTSVNQLALKKELFWSVSPCLFYGRAIDCQLDRDKYKIQYCGQRKCEECWSQEAKLCFHPEMTAYLLKKFDKFY